VTASAAISVGTIAVIMVILGDNLTLQVANENTIIASGIIAIAIGIIGLISYFHSPIESTKIIKRILVRAKMIEAEINSKGDIRRDYFMERIMHNISIVIEKLVVLENLLRNYIDKCQPQDWQNIRHIADRSSKEIEELEQEVILDFAHIVDLVRNRKLVDSSRKNNLYYSRHLCHEILQINPKYDDSFLREVRLRLRAQIADLDDILVLLEKEREN
jgi:hypothetical protein